MRSETCRANISAEWNSVIKDFVYLVGLHIYCCFHHHIGLKFREETVTSLSGSKNLNGLLRATYEICFSKVLNSAHGIFLNLNCGQQNHSVHNDVGGGFGLKEGEEATERGERERERKRDASFVPLKLHACKVRCFVQTYINSVLFFFG